MGRDDRSHLIWSWQQAERSILAFGFLTFARRATLSQELSCRRPIRLRNRGFIVGTRQRGLLDRADVGVVATLLGIFTFSCSGGSRGRRRAVGRNRHDRCKRIGLAIAKEIITPRRAEVARGL